MPKKKGNKKGKYRKELESIIRRLESIKNLTSNKRFKIELEAIQKYLKRIASEL